MRTLRRLTLGFASALTLAPVLAGAARAGDVTYPQLTNATSVLDTDMLATWRASGPLTRVNASVLEAYIQGKLSTGSVFLQTANNLSEFANSPSAARANLGLGSAALAQTGASGVSLCLLNSNCTWTGTQAFNAAVTMGSTLGVTGALSVTGAATLSGGVSGNLIATGTVGSTGGLVTVSGAAGTNRGLALQTNGVHRWAIEANSNPENGSNTGSDFCIASFSDTGSGITSPLCISRSSGLVTLLDGLNVSGGITGNLTGNVSGNATTATSATTAGSATIASAINSMAANTIVGNNSGGTANSSNLTAAQVVGMLGLTSNLGTFQYGSVTIPTNNGNVIINWGYNTSVGAGGTVTANFTTPYTSGALAVATGQGSTCAVASTSTTQIQIHNAASGVQTCYWIAIGN